MGGEHEARVNI